MGSEPKARKLYPRAVQRMVSEQNPENSSNGWPSFGEHFKCGQNELQAGLGQRGNVKHSIRSYGPQKLVLVLLSIEPKLALGHHNAGNRSNNKAPAKTICAEAHFVLLSQVFLLQTASRLL